MVLNVTVTEPTADSRLTVHPHGTARPDAANLTFTAGQTRADLVVVPVVDGRVALFNQWGDTHVIADLNGYFTA
ncbi:N-acetylmuramoyl-L-alanine amidase [Kitasatospora sp. NPDC101235]|uniref:N-acetylmuramoyl-L-alanine amidase n=1 Tax=Kitasatospora sp. NPDC101235 TaxID=3364101 RepID=UPI0037F1E56F